MDLKLQGKSALVTGASKGMGAAAARLFAAEGANVVVAFGADRAGADRTAREIRRVGQRAWTLRMEICDYDEVQQKIRQLPQECKPFDSVVLCAGENRLTSFEDLSASEWERIIQVNLHGTFHVLKAVTPHLQEGASVVIVSSVAGHTGAPHHAHYAAAKAGLVNLAKSAARALAPKIRVNCIAPGITLTEMGAETIDALEEGYAEKKLLAHRFADPEEIARWIVFLSSPAAGFAHGMTLDVNGGRLLR